MTSTTSTRRTTALRLTAIGVAAAGACVAGAGLAAAAAPASSFGQAVGTTAHAVGVEWSAMPDGYTDAQYEAFWGAGFTSADVAALEELWSLDAIETKSVAGQMVLDGEELPFEPGTHPEPEPPDNGAEAAFAFIDAGYTNADNEALSELWGTDTVETKIRGGEMLLDGKDLPVEPSGTPHAVSAQG